MLPVFWLTAIVRGDPPTEMFAVSTFSMGIGDPEVKEEVVVVLTTVLVSLTVRVVDWIETRVEVVE